MINLRASLALALCAAPLACKTRGDGPLGTVKDDEGLEDAAVPNDGKDEWTPLTLVRDDTQRWPAGKPAGGWWVTPIMSTLLEDGKVLVTGWGRRDRLTCGLHGTRQWGTTFLLDPDKIPHGNTLLVQPLDEQGNPGDVLYCAGGSTLRDGRVLFAGGARYDDLGGPNQLEYGLDYARLYDPKTNALSRVGPKLKDGPAGQDGWVWYPTVTRLPSGRSAVFGGFTRCCDGNFANLSIQTFDATRFDQAQDPWTTLVKHTQGRNELAPGLRDYTHALLLSKAVPSDKAGGLARQMAAMGAAGRWILLAADEGLDGAKRLTDAANGGRPGGGAGWNATSLLSPTGELMSMGGSFDAGPVQRADFYDPQTGKWRSVDTGIGRDNGASVLLPDGTILLLSGETDGHQLAGDRRRPQTIDPETLKVTTLPPWADDDKERGYHNTALVLKDGRLLVGGGISADGGIGCERPDLRLYSPTYLRRGVRPELAAAPPAVAMAVGGAPLSLAVKGPALKAKGGAALLAFGSQTHSFDQNQRYVALDFKRDGDTMTLTPPASELAAPAGDYMLYLVSEAGAVSHGTPVRLAPRAPDVRRTVVFIRGETTAGQDLFLRGGLDHGYVARVLGRNCTDENRACAVPIKHRNLKNATTAPWKAHDEALDWYGPESGQSAAAQGTAADWTTNHWTFGEPKRSVAADGFGEEPLNQWGDHYWMLDVDMDCSKTADGWFEVKTFITNGPGWEPDVAQPGAPYASGNHLAKCGKLSKFERGKKEAEFKEL